MARKTHPLTRKEMITLVERILRAEGTQAEQDADIQLFEANCKHPEGSDLIFWPGGVPHDPDRPERTAEEIVNLAMNPDDAPDPENAGADAGLRHAQAAQQWLDRGWEEWLGRQPERARHSFTAAISAFDQALAHGPGDVLTLNSKAKALCHRGGTECQMGEFTQARNDYQAAAEALDEAVAADQ